MTNRYAGTCYRCGKEVAAGEGVFEKVGKVHLGKWPGKALPKWLTQHHDCAVSFRGTNVHYEHAPLSGEKVDA